MSATATPEFDCWIVHCDGSAEPNPGRMGLGAVIEAPDGSRQAISEAAAVRGCNNEAELRAVMAALRQIRPGGAAVRIYSDNSILVEQLGAAAEVQPVARLAPLFDEARVLLAGFAHASLHWVPRHRNAEADALARAAIGLPPKPARKPRPRKRSR